MSRIQFLAFLVPMALVACGGSSADIQEGSTGDVSVARSAPDDAGEVLQVDSSKSEPVDGDTPDGMVDSGSDADAGVTCAKGTDDCNGNQIDGCEVTLTSDDLNCGSCGNACTAFESCVKGSCAAKSCPANMADCNGTNTDGCETSLKTDALNCGSCGTTCSANGGTASCSNGSCQIACSPGFNNCNGQVADGCEVNTKTDKLNCGSCGNVCNETNGAASCSNGSCQIACDANHANVNGNLADGCEVDLRDDPNNCGTVGNVCSNPLGAVGFCSNKVCAATCSAGYGNCDGNPLNGCEKLDTMSNCGACGTACNAGTQTCQAGACSTVICGAGTGNCDGNAFNGCETNITTVTNCGGCGVNCVAPPHMTASCNGACQFTCVAGWEDCNGNLADGCEVNLKADTNNCGACGNTCSQAGGVGSCSNGSCQIACTPGTTANCDGDVSDGCETSLKSDINNCGACGSVCPSKPHASPTCSAASCGTTCHSNWGDCNGNPADGCELDLSSDVNNCGACGHSCYGGTCSNGSCSYDVNQPYTATGGLISIVQIATDATNIYWTSSAGGSGKVSKVAKAGGPVTVLATGLDPRSLAVRNGFVYWNDLGNLSGGTPNKIQKTPVDGGATVTITSNYDQPYHLVVDDTNVYWLSSEKTSCYPVQDPVNCPKPKSTKLYKIAVNTVNGDGTLMATFNSEATDLSGNSTSLFVIRMGAFDAAKLTYSRGSIARVRKSDGAVGAMATDQSYPMALSSSENDVFWSGSPYPQTSDYKIHRSPLDTYIPESITGNVGMSVADSAADEALVVWSGAGIRKATPDGSASGIVAENQGSNVNSVALDGTHVYWAGSNGSTWFIRKAPR